MHQFDPVKYDPAEWAKLAKEAGMKYVVLTTRHHDGFCMFDSHFTDYKITNTPYGKDVTRMLADAFRAEGLRVGFYHSLPDWTHPGWSDQESPEYMKHNTMHEVSEAAHKEYLDLLYNHLNQLTTEYGKLDLLFLDYTSKYKADEDYYDRERMLNMIYKNQPDILVDDRLSFFKENVRDFDYYTPEICVPNQPVQVKGREVVWETCGTMNDHWAYCGTDHNYKSVEALTAGMMGCVSQNGNLLLNIGPTPEGTFPGTCGAAAERTCGMEPDKRRSGLRRGKIPMDSALRDMLYPERERPLPPFFPEAARRCDPPAAERENRKHHSAPHRNPCRSD